MYLSNPKRVHLVLDYLIRNPANIVRYVRDCYFGKSPLDNSLPWWSYEAIDWVKKHIKPQGKIFEWGSGGSTVFLSKYCQQLTSVENNEEWLEKTKKKLESKKINNVNLVKKTLNLTNEQQFRECDYFKALSENFNFIVIDGEDAFGPDLKWSSRETCFERAEDWINSQGFILVDDSWRYPKICKTTKANKVVRFQSIGPCRKGVTTTDLHCY
jgi:predicted O-methyltransferase YrrM